MLKYKALQTEHLLKTLLWKPAPVSLCWKFWLTYPTWFLVACGASNRHTQLCRPMYSPAVILKASHCVTQLAAVVQYANCRAWTAAVFSEMGTLPRKGLLLPELCPFINIRRRVSWVGTVFQTKHQSTVYSVVNESPEGCVCIAKVLACPSASDARRWDDVLGFEIFRVQLWCQNESWGCKQPWLHIGLMVLLP